MTFLVNVKKETECRLPSGFIREKISQSLRKIGFRKKAEISVLLTDKKKIRSLNKKFRKKDRATNILSFNFQEKSDFVQPRRTHLLLGEIIICVPLVKLEAKKRSVPFRKVMTELLIHGILHLLGYQHQKKEERKNMEGLEEKLIRLVN